ncbi:RagB/SusD family nutrient uptake outer membrane protein [Compostibacter hankyongensis]|uniref:RagB/SusD family nutrient uptake outer membrane protein n=1 Tax=Compostibacter hankyongensis TaxID=1007089 RepID=A0ABP8FJC5_9BACT
MKKTICYIVTAVVGIIAFSSCKKVLDQKAVDSFNEETVFQDINVTKAYLGNCYANMDGSVLISPTNPALSLNKDLLSTATDEMLNMQRPNIVGNIKGTLSPDNLGAFGQNWFQFIRWDSLYGNIQNVNTLLANIDKVPAPLPEDIVLRDRMKAEAYFIRAYDYTYLMRVYGGLILIDKPFNLGDDFLSVKRSGVDETLAFILKDIDSAMAGLPMKQDIEQGRATLGAAAALKSKLLSFCAGKLMNGGYEPSNPLVSFQKGSREERLKAAKQIAKEIMEGKYGHYALTGSTDDPPANMTDEDVTAYADNFYGIFMQKGAWNDEVMFGIQLKNAEGNQKDMNLSWAPNGWHNFGQNEPTEQLVRLFEMKDGTPFVWDKNNPGNDTLRDFTAAQLAADPERNPYVGREPRFYASILYDGAKWQQRPNDLAAQDPDNAVQTGYYIDANGKQRAGLDTRQTATESWNGTKTGYYVKKYVDKDLDGQYYKNDNAWIEFRYAEVVMDYAEACIELGEVSEGVKALNMIRNRAGLPDRVTADQAQAREWYRKERQLEFFGEGDRFYMMRKWMIAPDAISNLYPMLIYHYADGRTKWQYSVSSTSIVDKREWKDNAYWLPIARDEINKAPQIDQNPNY